MEILTQPIDQIESEPSFDREARESYFEMLEVAFQNLSIVDQKKIDRVVLVQK
jgi:hypothetical protein